MTEPTIEHTQFKRSDLLKLVGRFDSSQASIVEAQFNELMNQGRYHFVLDMSGTEFISSGVLRVLLSTHKQLRRWNRGDIYLAAVPERIANVLDLAGMTPIFKIYDNTTDAVGDW